MTTEGGGYPVGRYGHRTTVWHWHGEENATEAQVSVPYLERPLGKTLSVNLIYTRLVYRIKYLATNEKRLVRLQYCVPASVGCIFDKSIGIWKLSIEENLFE